MASTTIGALKYDLIADTEQFERSMTATRSELRQASKAFKDGQTPQERYGTQIDRLNNLRRKGLIDAKTYKRAIDQETQALKRADTQATKTSKSYDLLRKGLAIGAGYVGARAIIGGVNDELDRIDQIAKTARKLGLLNNELVGIQHAAAQMSGMMDSSVNMALQRMTRRISEAAAGTGEAVKAISELGLSAQQLNDVGPARAFRMIADAIKNVEAPADRLRLAFKLFDSEGAGLVTTLENGSAALDEYQKAAEDLGLTFTDEVAAGAEAANDALDDMSKAWKGVSASIIQAYIPAIKEAAGWLKWVSDMRMPQWWLNYWSRHGMAEVNSTDKTFRLVDEPEPANIPPPDWMEDFRKGEVTNADRTKKAQDKRLKDRLQHEKEIAAEVERWEAKHAQDRLNEAKEALRELEAAQKEAARSGEQDLIAGGRGSEEVYQEQLRQQQEADRAAFADRLEQEQAEQRRALEREIELAEAAAEDKPSAEVAAILQQNEEDRRIAQQQAENLEGFTQRMEEVAEQTGLAAAALESQTDESVGPVLEKANEERRLFAEKQTAMSEQQRALLERILGKIEPAVGVGF